MDLLFVIPNLFRGGAEYQLMELCKALVRDGGHAVRVVVFHGESTRDLPGYYQVVRELGIPLECLFERTVTGLPLLSAFHGALLRHRPQVVQSFLEANQYALLASLDPRLRHDLYFGIRNHITLGRGQRWLQRALRGRVTGFVGNARACTDWYGSQLGIPAERLHTIYNGLDLGRLDPPAPRAGTRAELGLDEHHRVFINVSNMHFPTKGHRELLAAWTRHAPAHPGDHLLLVGEGRLRPELTRMAREAGLAANTHFLGMRQDVIRLMKASDVYVSSSFVEGFSNSIAEARLCGLPVVATAVGGTPELAGDGPDAILVPPGDVEALARALGAPHPAPGEEVRRAFAAKVSLEHLGRDYLDLYARGRGR